MLQLDQAYHSRRWAELETPPLLSVETQGRRGAQGIGHSHLKEPGVAPEFNVNNRCLSWNGGPTSVSNHLHQAARRLSETESLFLQVEPWKAAQEVHLHFQVHERLPLQAGNKRGFAVSEHVSSAALRTVAESKWSDGEGQGGRMRGYGTDATPQTVPGQNVYLWSTPSGSCSGSCCTRCRSGDSGEACIARDEGVYRRQAARLCSTSAITPALSWDSCASTGLLTPVGSEQNLHWPDQASPPVEVPRPLTAPAYPADPRGFAADVHGLFETPSAAALQVVRAPARSDGRRGTSGLPSAAAAATFEELQGNGSALKMPTLRFDLPDAVTGNVRQLMPGPGAMYGREAGLLRQEQQQHLVTAAAGETLCEPFGSCARHDGFAMHNGCNGSCLDRHSPPAHLQLLQQQQQQHQRSGGGAGSRDPQAPLHAGFRSSLSPPYCSRDDERRLSYEGISEAFAMGELRRGHRSFDETWNGTTGLNFGRGSAAEAAENRRSLHWGTHGGSALQAAARRSPPIPPVCSSGIDVQPRPQLGRAYDRNAYMERYDGSAGAFGGDGSIQRAKQVSVHSSSTASTIAAANAWWSHTATEQQGKPLRHADGSAAANGGAGRPSRPTLQVERSFLLNRTSAPHGHFPAFSEGDGGSATPAMTVYSNGGSGVLGDTAVSGSAENGRVGFFASEESSSSSLKAEDLPPDCLLFTVRFKRLTGLFVLGPDAPGDLETGEFVLVEGDRGEDIGMVESRCVVSDYLERRQEEERAKAAARAAEPAPTGKRSERRRNKKQRSKASAGSEGGKHEAVDGLETNKAGPKIALHSVKVLLRRATDAEMVALKEKAEEEAVVLRSCRANVRSRNLPMRIVDVEYQFDRHKLTVFFWAGRRVDFRELVRDLFGVYKTRIWMEHLKDPPGSGKDAQSDRNDAVNTAEDGLQSPVRK